MSKKRLAIIYGTRPEIIKLSPVIKECIRRKTPFFSIHTGQHYSYQMDRIFFKELRLPAPDYRLSIRSKAPYLQGDHTGRMLIAIEKILLKEMPYCVIVQGDTNTAFSGALTAEKISTTESYTGFHIKVAHVEAGLRSYDRLMPEETNRFIADHLSDFLFAPAKKEKDILLEEGVPPARVFVTGNTIVDAVKESLGYARRKSGILKKLALNKDGYILLTLHRQENVDSRYTFGSILKGIEKASSYFNLPVIFPAHPRTVKMLDRFRLRLPRNIRITKPAGFLDFLWLEANARLAMTDSGGVQEEACILRVPCVTLRNNTERPETVFVGSNIIAGTSPRSIFKASAKMFNARRDWQNPLGDGKAAKRIIDIILER